MANASLKAVVATSLLLAGCACPHCARTWYSTGDLPARWINPVRGERPLPTDKAVVAGNVPLSLRNGDRNAVQIGNQGG